MSSRQAKRRRDRELRKKEEDEQRARILSPELRNKLYYRMYNKFRRSEELDYIQRQHVNGKPVEWVVDSNFGYFKKALRNLDGKAIRIKKKDTGTEDSMGS